MTLDLTGLPPTPAEVDAFLADNVARRLREGGRPAARLAALRRAHGPLLARRGPLRRHARPAPRQRARDVAVPRLGHRGVQRQHAVRPVHRRAARRRPAARTPTLEQQIATGFNRCNVTTSEGGSIDEEVLRPLRRRPRRDDVAPCFMGLTLGCAVCHDHKFDPVTQKEFYQLYAFFNSVGRRRDGRQRSSRRRRSCKLATPEQAGASSSELDEQIADVQQADRRRAGEDRVRRSGPPAPPPRRPSRSEYVWIDDAAPAGAQAARQHAVGVRRQAPTAGLQRRESRRAARPAA